MAPTKNAHERIVCDIGRIAGVMQLTSEPPVQPRMVLFVECAGRQPCVKE